MKPMVEIRNLKKYYGKGENLVKAVDHTNLTIERGKFTAIVGRSGSGKSTMLHLMGGLDRPDKGRVFIDGEDIFKLKAEQLAVFRRKKIGFIFQDYNLLPSLNVWENIVLPLGLDNKKVDHNYVMEIIKTISIEDKLKNLPNALSGGQKQRVAIARALINSPKLLLLDEPLGALDLKLRRTMQTELKRLQKKLGITFLYITHDQEEAINMSDRIVVMREGMLEQIGTPDEIYNHPKTAYVADFVGNANIIEGVVEEIGEEKIRVQIQGQRMEAEAAEGMKAGEKVKLAVRRENLQVCTEGENGLEAVVTDKSFQGGQLHVALQLKTGEELVASRYGMDARIVPGQKVRAVWKPEHAVPVDGKQEAEA